MLSIVLFLDFAGCPQILRSDRGTENCFLAACHMALRHGHSDMFAGEQAYRYGKSTSNTVELVLLAVKQSLTTRGLRHFGLS